MRRPAIRKIRMKKNLHTKRNIILWRELIALCVILAAQRVSGTLQTLTFAVLILWALRGPKQTIQALSFSWLLAFLNPGIFPSSGSVTIYRWVLIFGGFARVVFEVLRRRPRVIKEILYFLPFAVGIAVLSVFYSYEPIISLFKLISFVVGGGTIILAFCVTAEETEYWKAWFTTFLLAIMIIGFPFYYSELGYTRNERGFQGLLSHPQSYGLFLAPAIAWLAGRFLFEKERSVYVVGGITIGVLSLVATQSRTAAFALLLALVLTLMMSMGHAPGRRRTLIRTLKHPLAVSVFCFGMIFVIWKADLLSEQALSFVKKGVDTEGFVSVYKASRGDLIERSMNNFYQYPLTGIGFGLPSSPQLLEVQKDKWVGLPLGATIEKGFLPSAILEEVGLIGSGFVMFLLFALVSPLMRRGTIPGVWLLMTCLTINLGEEVFFSMGGMGLYIWLLIGLTKVMSEKPGEADNLLAR